MHVLRWWRLRSAAFVAAALVAALVAAGLVAPQAQASAGTGAPGRACSGYVGLTFDDGPTPGNTPALLAALRTAGLRATMFNVGQNVEANPDLTRAQVAAGMWIGDHSWDHPHMTQLTAEQQDAQISRTQDVVARVTGATPRLFRPPYLETDDGLRAVELRHGLTEINADVDSQDWNNATADQIAAKARQLRSGDVILMHDWPANTVQAIPRIAADLRERGLCAGRISPVTGRAVAPGATCAAAYRTIAARDGAFRGEVVVTNTGSTPLDGWRVTLTLPAGARISSLKNGVATGATGTVTVTGTPHNSAVGAGRSTAFGLTGTGDGAVAGVTCADPSGDTLARARTVGRVEDLGDSVRYTWPGITFEGRFQGSGVGIELNDAANDYDVQIDGGAPVTLRTPGRTTHWVTGLGGGVHTVRLAKRTESPWTPGEFGGFVAAPGGRVLAPPAARARQIEFIGDSWTAGYGNMSTSRDCSASGGINPNSNADQTFGALTARALNADHQLTAWSGMGMVRNYNGSSPGTDFRTYYDRTLQAAGTAAWQPPRTWRPQVVVVGLGINDFSTPLNPGEPWADTAALAADFRAAYLGFLAKLRLRYGPGTSIVLTYPTMSGTPLADSVQQVVRERNSQGDTRVSALHYDNDALGLDLLGCDWHPSLHDHRLLAGALGRFIGTLPVRW
ncbi:polysaccharide deacetylase family protein [Nonomuraea wenchangensis]|uniref:Peptidoglycan/xylan/chitin deacetylase, PgdA/CDA1 family n=1 Tax=Nonomuraea wenchangensis TaxID=568860 RepID=A0A1I0L8S2_9ACTN|nr:polysaccharide deacetylase family protein [Nonomuraea wenchangensis]SEU36279.1 Peptidoglycan/xylan/chitin deacetylase, PgdA/CDA1 family [Nonomuraea wenchangensis]